MLTSETIDLISPAFVKAQAQFEAISKDKDNPFFHSKYADIESILSMARPVLAEQGLSILQMPAPAADGVMIQTVLLHESGQWIADEYLHIVAAKQDPQGYGAAITYGRRYALLMFLCLVTEDDDGNTATQALSKVEQARLAAADRAQKAAGKKSG